MLTLPIKKKWFDMILSGKKKEEYREVKPYWLERFRTIGLIGLDHGVFAYVLDNTADVEFRNGYQKDAPRLMAMVKLRVGPGKEEWGAEPGKEYLVLEIKQIEATAFIKEQS